MIRAAVLSLALLPAAAQAETGCWSRDYTDAHLAAHPDQIVRTISIRFFDADYGPAADLTVTLANQGHVAAEGMGGQVLQSPLVCSDDGGFCGIECDGGYFDIARTGDRLSLTTSRIIVGGGCESGSTDLAEQPGEPVTYLLSRAPDAACPEIAE